MVQPRGRRRTFGLRPSDYALTSRCSWLAAQSGFCCGPRCAAIEHAYLTSFRLRPAMRRAQHRFLTSGCSTYLLVRLRAPRIENVTAHGTSPASLQNPVRCACLRPHAGANSRRLASLATKPCARRARRLGVPKRLFLQGGPGTYERVCPVAGTTILSLTYIPRAVNSEFRITGALRAP